jgi:hypothetical protein
MHFAQVYRFVGDIFDPDTPCHVEAHLQKLKDMDGITVKTVSVLQNCRVSVTFVSIIIGSLTVSPALLP